AGSDHAFSGDMLRASQYLHLRIGAFAAVLSAELTILSGCSGTEVGRNSGASGGSTQTMANGGSAAADAGSESSGGAVTQGNHGGAGGAGGASGGSMNTSGSMN